MTTQPTPPQTPSSEGFSTALAAFLRGLLRLIVVLLLGGLLGLAIFFGLPYLNQQITEPIQRNSAAITELQSSQQQLENEMDGWLETAQDRLLALEIAQDTIKEQIDLLTSQVSALENDSASLAATAEASAENLNALSTQVAAPDPRSTELARTLARQEGEIAQLQTDLESLQSRLEERDTGTIRLADLNRELQLLKAAQLLTRARLALARSDTIAARMEINGARTVLAALLEETAEADAGGLQAIVQRLELAVSNLEEAPLLAVEDVEIAFRLLFGLTGEDQVSAESESAAESAAEPAPTGTVLPVGSPSPTPTSTPEGTPAGPTPTPTATPGS